MPNVAQKLCHDIVGPVKKRPPANARRFRSTYKASNSSSTINQDAKPPKFVHIDRKTSNKNKISNTDGMTLIKSKTSILTALAEAGVNTLVTGPLRCDNNCVTLVRKRDRHSSCKCGNKRPNTKCSAKSMQTLLKRHTSGMDKACTHIVQTATRGTQFFDKNSLQENKETTPRCYITQKIPKDGSTRIESGLDRCINIQSDSCNHHFVNINNNAPLRFVTVKRWALSNYPTRGPDF